MTHNTMLLVNFATTIHEFQCYLILYLNVRLFSLFPNAT